MSEKRIASRKRAAPETQGGSSSAAPTHYYGSPPMSHHPEAQLYPPMYGHPHYQYHQGSPPHFGRPMGYPHPQITGSMPPGAIHPVMETSMRHSLHQVTPESNSTFPYGSPPTLNRRRTFTGGTGTLSPLRRQRRSGTFSWQKSWLLSVEDI